MDAPIKGAPGIFIPVSAKKKSNISIISSREVSTVKTTADKCVQTDKRIELLNCICKKPGSTSQENPIAVHMQNIRKVVTGKNEDILIVGHDAIKAAVESVFLLMNNLKTPIKTTVVCQNFLLAGLGGLGKTELMNSLAVKVARLIKKPVSVFNVKSSDLMHKFVGESEKSIDALFDVVECNAPSILLFDEVDGLMMKRTDDETDASRRFKTGLLAALRGNRKLENVVIVAATNRAADLDDNFASRFEYKFLVKPPNEDERARIFNKFFTELKDTIPVNIKEGEYKTLVMKSEGYSGNDIKICVGKTAANCVKIMHNGVLYRTENLDEIRAELEACPNPAQAILKVITCDDLLATMAKYKPSLAAADMKALFRWARKNISSYD